jgi:pyruvate/2-oxoglutarate dehydrogenase complex dihydrolipoamide acyltransferase (E2) component
VLFVGDMQILQIGGTYASPVIFPPQVAIGAIGRFQRVPRFDEDADSDDEDKVRC